MITNEEKLKQFLEENNLEIVPTVVVGNADLFSMLKTAQVNIVLGTLKAEYKVQEKKKEPKDTGARRQHKPIGIDEPQA